MLSACYSNLPWIILSVRIVFILFLVLSSCFSFVLCSSQCSLLSLFIFLAHLAQACELTPNIIDFHSSEKSLFANHTYFLSLKHSASFICVIIIIWFIASFLLIFFRPWTGSTIKWCRNLLPCNHSIWINFSSKSYLILTIFWIKLIPIYLLAIITLLIIISDRVSVLNFLILRH